MRSSDMFVVFIEFHWFVISFVDLVHGSSVIPISSIHILLARIAEEEANLVQERPIPVGSIVHLIIRSPSSAIVERAAPETRSTDPRSNVPGTLTDYATYQ